MLHLILPDEYCPSIYDYDFAGLKGRGVKALGFDIDNTLVPHDAPLDGKSAALLERLKQMGFSIMILSNNQEERVRSFAEAAGIDYLHKAAKPKKKPFRTMLERYGLKPEEAAFFGDQLFTDILGARRSGIYCVLGKPIDPKTDPPHIVVKRILEKPLLPLVIALRRK